MQKALLDGEIVSCLSVMSSYNVSDPKEVHRLKLASSQRKLICIDCGEPVRFRYGGKYKYMPHFSHYPGSVCSMEGHTPFESEAHESCITQLYFYFRNLGISVEIDKPLECRRRANLYLGSQPNGIAIEVVANAAGFKALCSKLDDYRIHGIKNLWVLCAENSKEFVSNNEPFIYPILENGSDKPLVILNEKADRLTLLKRAEYRDSSGQLVRDIHISKDYDFQETIYSFLENRFETDFEDFFEQEQKRFTLSVISEIESEVIKKMERETQAKLLEKQIQEQRDEVERRRQEWIKERRENAEAAREQSKNLESGWRKITQNRGPETSTQNHIPHAVNSSLDRAKRIVDLVIAGKIGPSDILFFEDWINNRWKDYVELGYTHESMRKVVWVAMQKPGLHIQSQKCLARIMNVLKSKDGLS